MEHKGARKMAKCFKVTLSEQKLYKQLANLRKKIAEKKNVRNKIRASFKIAHFYTKNAQIIKVMEKFALNSNFKRVNKDMDENFTMKDKVVALMIMQKSLKAYKLLSRLFVLPTPEALIKLLTIIKPKSRMTVFAVDLKERARKLTRKNKLCVLLFKQINCRVNAELKSNAGRRLADHCLIFMIRGVVKKYDKVIGYVFRDGSAKCPDLVHYIKTAIIQLQDAGFNPLATICDQSLNNQDAINCLVNETKAQFQAKGDYLDKNLFYINGQEIIPIYDPPNLLIEMRNYLLKKDLHYKMNERKCVAKWEHIEKLYNNGPPRLLVRVGGRSILSFTEHHMYPSKLKKTKLEFAAQIFSSKIGGFLGFFAKHKLLPEGWNEVVPDTADLLLFFDKLFDSVNGCRGEWLKKREYVGKDAVGPATWNSVHQKLWEAALPTLKTMVFTQSGKDEKVTQSGKDEKVSPISNWIWTIEGYQMLVKNIIYGQNVRSIWMRRLNLDPLNWNHFTGNYSDYF